ncbi:hypothetical protein PENTCL1PPCAC_16406, partial [Pristionchus entomophagus]
IKSLETALLFALLFFAVVTILIASMLIYVICNRRFKMRNNSFFLVYAIGYVFNIVSMVALNVGKTLVAWDWLPDSFTQTETTARIVHFALFFSRSGELHSTVFTALNRMSAIMLPNRYDE